LALRNDTNYEKNIGVFQRFLGSFEIGYLSIIYWNKTDAVGTNCRRYVMPAARKLTVPRRMEGSVNLQLQHVALYNITSI